MSYRRHFSKDFNIPLDISIRDPHYSIDNEGKLSHISSGSVHVNFNGHTFNYSIGGHGGSGSHDLSQKVDAKLMHLREQAKTLQVKKEQMENDYQRTRARYIKIVQDLDKELEHRVKALDEPIFKMVAKVEGESERMINADFAEIASIIAKENTALSAQIGAAMTKKRARQAIMQATEFLRTQKLTNLAIDRSTISGIKSDEGEFFLPVCYFEAKEAGGVVKHDCTFDKEHLPQSVAEKVDDAIFSNPNAVIAMHPVERDNINKFFNAIIQEAFQASKTPHDIRVVNTISKLFFE